MQQPDSFGQQVFSAIRNDWGKMLYSGATSFWETIRGGWDFGCAGSLCHGWSGIPVYFYGAYALGITPLENGFKTFRVAPFGGAFDKADGTVPTPVGNIVISWEKVGGEMIGKLVCPQSLTPVFADNIDLTKWEIILTA